VEKLLHRRAPPTAANVAKAICGAEFIDLSLDRRNKSPRRSVSLDKLAAFSAKALRQQRILNRAKNTSSRWVSSRLSDPQPTKSTQREREIVQIMNKEIFQFKTTTTPPLFIPILLVCFGLAPMAQAVGPDTDGTIPGSNNGEGIGVLVSRTGGVWNTGTGFEALNQLTSGNQNTAMGLRALTSDTNGGFNTATGVYSLYSNAIGFFNSATGAYSLANNISGNYNTANGYAALYRNTASNNTATGFAALYRNTTGSVNTANGYLALFSNTTGTFNTANGVQALSNNTIGANNTATGNAALSFNIAGYENTANGAHALRINTNGIWNTAIGFDALFNNTGGIGNTAIGYSALFSNSTGSINIALGYFAGENLTTGNDNIDIGNHGVAGASNTMRIGAATQTRTFIAGIRGVTTVNAAIPVLIDTVGQLGTASSSRRYKKEIKPMDSASEAILALKPVTFHYKSDPAAAGPQFGLIAEEVAEINPDLVVRDGNGEIYTVRYDAVNAMLLNEFLKEHRKVEEHGREMQKEKATINQLDITVANQEATIAQLKSTVAQQQKEFQVTAACQEKEIESLTASLKEQAAQIQKVSAQLKSSRSAPQIVLNDHQVNCSKPN